jgi:Tfp pilus assembly protein PilF
MGSLVTSLAQPTRRARVLLVLGIGIAGLLATAAACGGLGQQQSPDQRVQVLLTTGLTAQLQGQTPVATSSYHQVLTLDPKNKFAYYNLGLIDQLSGNNDSAEKNYRQAIATDPNFSRALFNLAILRTSADPAEAESLYRRAIAADPNMAGAHLNLGFLLISTGRQAAGQAELNKAVAIDSSLASRAKASAAPSPSPAASKP